MMIFLFSISDMGKLFIKLKNNYMLCVLLVSPLTLLRLLKNYLIKLWICDNGELITTLSWESNENVDNLKNEVNNCIKELSKRLSRGLRATIEEKC